MNAFILSTGDELVRGRTRDTNTAEIARALSAAGLRVVGASLVGDRREALANEIRRAAGLAQLIVMSGGLGPTEDDCTRGAAADAAGVALRRDPGVVEWLRERWFARGREMPESNLLQADLPEGADVLPNAYGTAPGFHVRIGGAHLFALPGPPWEMRGVLADEALPRVQALLPEGLRVVRTRAIETFGEREARVGELIADMMGRDARPTVGTTAARGTIRVILHAEGKPQEVDDDLARGEAEVRRRLGRLVFGSDGETLEQVVVARLISTGATIATAESCTGGLLAAALTSQPGVSSVFRGAAVTYSNEEKTRLLGVPPGLFATGGPGVVSEEVACAMAEGARTRFGVDVAVGVTGIAGPGGGTEAKPVGLVHLALATPDCTTHRRVILPGDRALIREITVKCALNMLRRHLT